MKCKAFELRYRGAMMPAVAIRLEPENEAERFLLRLTGYSLQDNPPFILLGHLEGGRFTYDKFEDQVNSTRFTAHEYIREHWNELESGQVICTEFIRGERTSPKESERPL